MGVIADVASVAGGVDELGASFTLVFEAGEAAKRKISRYRKIIASSRLPLLLLILTKSVCYLPLLFGAALAAAWYCNS